MISRIETIRILHFQVTVVALESVSQAGLEVVGVVTGSVGAVCLSKA